MYGRCCNLNIFRQREIVSRSLSKAFALSAFKPPPSNHHAFHLVCGGQCFLKCTKILSENNCNNCKILKFDFIGRLSLLPVICTLPHSYFVDIILDFPCWQTSLSEVIALSALPGREHLFKSASQIFQQHSSIH